MKLETLRRYFAQMPPLNHYPLRNCREFRWEDSEVVRFIASHPQFMTNLFCRLRKSGVIVFNSATQTWCGYRYREGGNPTAVKTCNQNPTLFFDSRHQNPNTPPRGVGIGGIFDGRLSPYPFLTADRGFDDETQTEVPHE